jgi:hypothetical protein
MLLRTFRRWHHLDPCWRGQRHCPVPQVRVSLFSCKEDSSGRDRGREDVKQDKRERHAPLAAGPSAAYYSLFTIVSVSRVWSRRLASGPSSGTGISRDRARCEL